MKPSLVLEKFNALADQYDAALSQYSEADFVQKPAEDAWSIGQMYLHLTRSTEYFHLKNVEMCLENPENGAESKKMPGKIMFFYGGFLPIKVKVPPSEAYTPPQPKNIESESQKLADLRPKMAEIAKKIENSTQKSGKTPHPALGFLSAEEWFSLVEMHFRHHLRQKRRIDAFLGK
jgi:hypothetical protein